MANPKIYPVVVDDFIPFCIFIVANNKKDAIKTMEETYDWIKECENINYLPPFNINQGTIFAIDVEMSIIEDSTELFKWVSSDEDGFYVDGFKTKPGEIIVIEHEENSDETKEDVDDNSESKEPEESKYLWL